MSEKTCSVCGAWRYFDTDGMGRLIESPHVCKPRQPRYEPEHQALKACRTYRYKEKVDKRFGNLCIGCGKQPSRRGSMSRHCTDCRTAALRADAKARAEKRRVRLARLRARGLLAP